MKRALLAVFLVAAGAAGVGVAVAHEPAAQSDDFHQFLTAIDVLPPSREAIEARWPDAVDRLLAVAMHHEPGQQAGWPRLRAMSLLSFFPEPKVRAALEALAENNDAEVRRLAIYTVARTFGVPGDEALVSLVVQAAKSPDQQVSEHAVRALRWVDHPQALLALEQIARDSQSPDLRKLAGATLQRRAHRLVTR